MKELIFFAIGFPLIVVISVCYIVAVPVAFSLLDASLLSPLNWSNEVRGVAGYAWAIIQVFVLFQIIGAD